MKTLLLAITLLTSFSVFSYEQFTNDYFVIYNGDYSNSKGKDTTCSISTVKQNENFIIKSTTGNMRLTYNKKVLSISINDINDEKSIGHYKHVGTFEIDPDLTNPKFVFVSVVTPKKNTFRKIITRTHVSLRCTF